MFLTAQYELFLPIGQWPRLVRMMKKTGGQKSCWTVPLNHDYGLLRVVHHEVYGGPLLGLGNLRGKGCRASVRRP